MARRGLRSGTLKAVDNASSIRARTGSSAIFENGNKLLLAKLSNAAPSAVIVFRVSALMSITGSTLRIGFLKLIQAPRVSSLMPSSRSKPKVEFNHKTNVFDLSSDGVFSLYGHQTLANAS